MTGNLTLDPKTSALLVMDFQTAVVEMVAIDKLLQAGAVLG
jgi:hypothetical protein